MTGLPQTEVLLGDRPAERETTSARAVAAFSVAISTALVVIGLAGLIIATPWYLDGALDRAGSPAILGLSPDVTHAISWSTETELFFGSGAFAQTVIGPGGTPTRFFGASEAAHLRDVQLLARSLVVLILAGALVFALALARGQRQSWTWRAISRGAAGLAVGVTLVGGFFVVAFDAAFTLFHLIFFPGGNWSFDQREARMVQLYPPPFWDELVLVFAALTLALAIVVWALARRRARRIEAA
jgi:Protein of unknown function (DUF1461)